MKVEERSELELDGKAGCIGIPKVWTLYIVWDLNFLCKVEGRSPGQYLIGDVWEQALEGIIKYGDQKEGESAKTRMLWRKDLRFSRG